MKEISFQNSIGGDQLATCNLCGAPSGDRDLCEKCESEIAQAVDKILKSKA